MAAFAFMFFIAMPGPFFPAINTELILLLQVLESGQDPALMVLAASGGHMTLYLLLHAMGEKTLTRWGPMARRLAAMTTEKRERFRNGATAGLVVGSLLGVPPVVVLAPLSSSVGFPRWRLAVITLLGRIVRFGVLVSLGGEALRWLQS
ncbi:MAG: hypothetical protein AB2A00_17120 [Myxococcota bacterium]